MRKWREKSEQPAIQFILAPILRLVAGVLNCHQKNGIVHQQKLADEVV